MNVEILEESKTIYGLTIRTKNANEVNQETAKIGGLWASFASKVAPHLEQTQAIYGVYSSYESDYSGEFNVTAGSEKNIEELDGVVVEAGRYLVFKAEGEMPQAVIQAWTDVWNYFSDENSEFKRLYQTDYELYDGPASVKVYIGIE